MFATAGSRRLHRAGQSSAERLHRAFDGTCRWEWLNQNVFGSVEEAQDIATSWMAKCYECRRHQGLGGVTPAQKLAASGQRYRRGGGLVYVGSEGVSSGSFFEPFGVFRAVGRGLRGMSRSSSPVAHSCGRDSTAILAPLAAAPFLARDLVALMSAWSRPFFSGFAASRRREKETPLGGVAKVFLDARRCAPGEGKCPLSRALEGRCFADRKRYPS